MGYPEQKNKKTKKEGGEKGNFSESWTYRKATAYTHKQPARYQQRGIPNVGFYDLWLATCGGKYLQPTQVCAYKIQIFKRSLFFFFPSSLGLFSLTTETLRKSKTDPDISSFSYPLLG